MILTPPVDFPTPKPVGDPVVQWKNRYGKAAWGLNFQKPSGDTYDFGVFDYKNRAQPVIIFPLTSEGQVVAVWQFREAANEVILEIPGGNKRKPDDTPELIARTELLEETGYEPRELVCVTPKPIYFEPASFTPSFYGYIAYGCRKVAEPRLDRSESIRMQLISLDVWKTAIFDGSIHDCKTIALSLMAFARGGCTP